MPGVGPKVGRKTTVTDPEGLTGGFTPTKFISEGIKSEMVTLEAAPMGTCTPMEYTTESSEWGDVFEAVLSIFTKTTGVFVGVKV